MLPIPTFTGVKTRSGHGIPSFLTVLNLNIVKQREVETTGQKNQNSWVLLCRLCVWRKWSTPAQKLALHGRREMPSLRSWNSCLRSQLTSRDKSRCGHGIMRSYHFDSPFKPEYECRSPISWHGMRHHIHGTDFSHDASVKTKKNIAQQNCLVSEDFQKEYAACFNYESISVSAPSLAG